MRINIVHNKMLLCIILCILKYNPVRRFNQDSAQVYALNNKHMRGIGNEKSIYRKNKRRIQHGRWQLSFKV